MAEGPSFTKEDIKKAKKVELVEMCQTCNLDSSGTKKELQDRLLEYLSEKPVEEEREEIPEEEIPEEELPEEISEEAEGPPIEEEPEEKAPPEEEEIPEEREAEKPEKEGLPIEEEMAEERPPEIEEKEVEEEVAAPLPEEKVTEEPIPKEVPPPPEERPPERKIEHPCPKCGKELSYVEKYGRWYCYDCKSYAPAERKVEEVPKKEARTCPRCGRSLSYVSQYDRWYCHSCRSYAPKEVAAPPVRKKPVAPAAPPREVKLCPTCGGALRYVRQYDRWYCHSCRSYAPKEVAAPPVRKKPVAPAAPPREVKLCPTCGGALRYVRQYDRWYCHSCRSYAPSVARPAPAPPAARKPEKNCTTCGRPLRYIAQYKRWYCDSCRAYEGVEKVSPAPAVPPAVKRCLTCGSNMRYIPNYGKYYCYTCRAYKPVAAPPQRVTVAVRPTATPSAASVAAARPAALAAPTVTKKDTTAMIGFYLILCAVLIYIVSTIVSLLVGSGVMDPVYIVDSGNFRMTFWGEFLLQYDTGMGVMTHFNLLLFLALLFGIFGLMTFILAFAKRLTGLEAKR